MARSRVDPKRDRKTILDQSRRREIARCCRQRPASVHDLEKRLGARSLQGVVENLKDWGVLVPVGSTQRGAPVFTLASDWGDELNDAIRRNGAQLIADQRLVVLGQCDLSETARCLAREHSHEIAWVGVLGEREGLIIGVSGMGESPAAEMKETLRQAGVDCDLKAIGEAATGAEVAPFLRGFGASEAGPLSA